MKMKELIFVLVLSSFSNGGSGFCIISLDPHERIALRGTTHILLCQGWTEHDVVNGISVQWYLNKTIYNSGRISDIRINASPISRRLTFYNALEVWNDTEVFCSVTFRSGITCNSTTSTFIVQGAPDEVSDPVVILNFDCSQGQIFVNWTAPLNIHFSDIDVDIHYIVGVTYAEKTVIMEEINSNSFMTTLTDTNINNTNCKIIEVRVTPFNVGGNGTSTLIRKNPIDDITVAVIQGEYIEEKNINYTILTTPGICSVGVSLIDIDTEEEFTLHEDNVNVLQNCSCESHIIITTLNSKIRENQHYNVTYNFTSDAQSSKSNTISTHDIQDISIDTNTSILNVDYLNHSEAKGVLLLFQEMTVDYTVPYLLSLDKEESKQFYLYYSLRGCSLHLFDIEKDGLLNQGINYPAKYVSEIPQLEEHGVKEITSRSISFFCQNSTWQNIVSISCNCTEIFEGYQYILIHDNATDGLIYTNYSSCSIPVNIYVQMNGTWHIYVSLIENTTGITKSNISYIGNIEVGEENQQLVNDNSTTNTETMPQDIRTNTSNLLIIIIVPIVGVTVIIGICITIGICIRKKILKCLRRSENSSLQQSQETSKTKVTEL